MKLAVVTLLAGCFNPRVTHGLPCSTDNWCPPPELCGADGFCSGGNGSDVDAAPPLPETNLVFVTANTFVPAGTEADIIAAADAQCQMEGSALRAGTYLAFLGNTFTDAAMRFQNVMGGWARPDGMPVTTSYDDFMHGVMYYPIRIDAQRHDMVVTHPASHVLTQLVRPAPPPPQPRPCNYGVADGDEPNWWLDGAFGDPCAESYLYCFEQDRSVAVAPPTLDGNALSAFVTGADHTVNMTIDDLDGYCAGEASARGLAGTFAAFVAPLNDVPRSRFLASSKPWTRLDGVIVAQPTLHGFDAPLDVTPSGMKYVGTVGFGALNPDGIGQANATCMGWASLAIGSMLAGASTRSDGHAFSGANPPLCSNAVRFYCLQKPSP